VFGYITQLHATMFLAAISLNTLLASPYHCGHRLAREPLPPVSPRALISGGIVHCACLDEINYCCLNLLVTELPLVFSKKKKLPLVLQQTEGTIQAVWLPLFQLCMSLQHLEGKQ
jgi:hypothetical protein